MDDEYRKKVDYLMYFAKKMLERFGDEIDGLPDDFDTWLIWNRDLPRERTTDNA